MRDLIRVSLGPSRTLASLLGGAHTLAAGALWVTPVPVAWAFAGSFLFALHLGWVLRHHAWRSARHALVELELSEDSSAAARSREGEWKSYRVAASSFVSARLTVVNLRPERGRGRRAVLLTTDNVDPDGFRRLRVCLRWRGAGRRS